MRRKAFAAFCIAVLFAAAVLVSPTVAGLGQVSSAG